MTDTPSLRNRLEIAQETANLEGLLRASFPKDMGAGREDFHAQVYAALAALRWVLGDAVAPSDPLALVEGWKP